MLLQNLWQMRQPYNRLTQLRLFLPFQRIRVRALEMSVQLLLYSAFFLQWVICTTVFWNIILPLQKKCLVYFTPLYFVFLSCHLTCMEEGCNVDSNNIRHLKRITTCFCFVFFESEFSGGQKVGLWLCWVTNCIFFSENLCKVGSFVLTLILFVWHLCPLLTRPLLYKWVFFFKERYLLKYGNSLRIKRSTDITHPLVVSEKSAWLIYVLVQDILKNQLCASKHASTSLSLYLTGSKNKTMFFFCYFLFVF